MNENELCTTRILKDNACNADIMAYFPCLSGISVSKTSNLSVRLTPPQLTFYRTYAEMSWN